MFANCQLRSVKFIKEMHPVEAVLILLNVNVNIGSLLLSALSHMSVNLKELDS